MHYMSATKQTTNQTAIAAKQTSLTTLTQQNNCLSPDKAKTRGTIPWHSHQAPVLELYQKDPRLMLISQDIPPGGGEKQYAAVKYSPKLLQHILECDKHLYELLPENRPRRLYMDIDVKGKHPNFQKYTNDQYVHACDTLVQSILTLLPFFLLTFLRSTSLTHVLQRI